MEEKSTQGTISGSWISNTLEWDRFLGKYHDVISLFIRQLLLITARDRILDNIGFWCYLREYLFLHVSE